MERHWTAVRQRSGIESTTAMEHDMFIVEHDTLYVDYTALH